MPPKGRQNKRETSEVVEVSECSDDSLIVPLELEISIEDTENFVDDDDEITEEDMAAEIERNQIDVEHLQKQMRKSNLKKELMECRKRLEEMKILASTKGMPTISNVKSGLKLTDLRKMSQLGAEVDNRMTSIGLVDSDSDSDVSMSFEKDRSKTRPRISTKSGINARSSDMVVCPRRWPHASLHFQHASKNYNFADLPLNLFVAGELKILSNSETLSVERDGRLALLKKIV
ncbi:hypothetical protein LOTGIDRAFT_156958 [Lottia gigantea]|uniref:Uncharacterized protein n=1 Tax=Lottia gigantea TaxID=225164 RepID=V4CL55_LOTGI|nr:hypothetical protein LOTGIDRAFT_156958 [Lottia gigantea]ESP03000.1 hypothetical protein LOTGIDRAFT_156958 [Lottia gigantea]